MLCIPGSRNRWISAYTQQAKYQSKRAKQKNNYNLRLRCCMASDDGWMYRLYFYGNELLLIVNELKRLNHTSIIIIIMRSINPCNLRNVCSLYRSINLHHTSHSVKVELKSNGKILVGLLNERTNKKKRMKETNGKKRQKERNEFISPNDSIADR